MCGHCATCTLVGLCMDREVRVPWRCVGGSQSRSYSPRHAGGCVGSPPAYRSAGDIRPPRGSLVPSGPGCCARGSYPATDPAFEVPAPPCAHVICLHLVLHCSCIVPTTVQHCDRTCVLLHCCVATPATIGSCISKQTFNFYYY